jgi:hypothetical protein
MIEENIPMPEPRKTWPFKDMDVGHSVFFQGETTQGKAGMAARAYAQVSRKKFSARAVDGGVRIWRTA